MTVTARFQTPLRPSAPAPIAAPTGPDYPPEDRDLVRIEAAMLELGRAAGNITKSMFLAEPIPPSEYPTTSIGWLLRDPVVYALRSAHADLLLHLQRIVSHAEAMAINSRVNATLFAEFDRPRIDASGAKQ